MTPYKLVVGDSGKTRTPEQKSQCSKIITKKDKRAYVSLILLQLVIVSHLQTADIEPLITIAGYKLRLCQLTLV